MVLQSFPRQVEKREMETTGVSAPVVSRMHFSRHTALLDATTIRVMEIVKLLRGIGSGQPDKAKENNSRLQ